MKSDKKLDLSVIIVNYNTADFLGRCLTSIAHQTDVNAEVIVVDNCSEDGSPDFVREEFPWVRLIANEQNLGFSKANNQALKDCNSKYIYFLNPDTEVRSGAFKNMVDFMYSHPKVGLAGTQLVNPDGSPQSSVEIRYPGQRHARNELKDLKEGIAWVMGSSMIARLEVIRGVDGFDEHYFLYGEDLDLCLRIRKSGWDIGYIPEAMVIHWGGQSERNNLPVEVWEKKIRAEALFYQKHYSPKTVRAIDRWNFYQACWRICTLKLELLIAPNKKQLHAKLEKYRLVRKMLRSST
jgi:N-acetylglucosaminyl-diphospho-decaprenol L-rhamnosyltransferase